MTKGDLYTKEIITKILEEGTLDENPRPSYADGTKAHTLSINHGMCTYDQTKNESPLITLRPIAVKSSVGELLWIYRDQDSNIYNLETKYNVRWWREWCINPYHYDKHGDLVEGFNNNNVCYYDEKGNLQELGNKSDTVDKKTDIDSNGNIVDSNNGNVLTKDASIGSCYGSTVRRHNQTDNLINGIKNDPFGRRHIIDLWQVDDFKEKHGLKPCAFLTEWNVRKKDGEYYLDMCLTQRSSDYLMAGCINQTQYLMFLYMMAKNFNMKPGRFTWFYNNIQVYDRHFDAAKELLKRDTVECNPKIEVNENVNNFYDMKVEDVKLTGYPREEISKKNPQLKLEIAI
ncbi:MAG: hypothetical protein IKE73_02515 [Bacilli bacterium]|nr:hypothetical protein [Bacilli bacterium]